MGGRAVGRGVRPLVLGGVALIALVGLAAHPAAAGGGGGGGGGGGPQGTERASTTTEPAPPEITCVVPPTEEVAAPFIVIADGQAPGAAEEAKAVVDAAKAESAVELLGAYETVAPPPSMTLNELGSERPAQLPEEATAYLVVAVGDSGFDAALNERPDFGSNPLAFVRLADELGPEAEGVVSAINGAYLEKVQATADATVVTAIAEDAGGGTGQVEGQIESLGSEPDGSAGFEVTVPGLPPGKPLAVDPSSVVLDGVAAPSCAPASVPFVVQAPASQGDVYGRELEFSVAGTPITALFPEDPDESADQTTDSPSNSSGGDGGSEANDDGGDGGTSPIVLLLAIGAVAVGGIALVWFLRRGGKSSPAGGADPSLFPAVGAAGPPPGYAAPDAAVGAAVAPAAAPMVGRAVDAPEVGPLVVPDPAPGWTAAVPRDAAIRIADVGLMRVLPTDRPSGRTWASQTSATVSTAGWLEKKPGRGEDAEPTLRSHENGRGLLAVYDGTGGAGSATARKLRDGTELTGAYVAARLARDLTESWYAEVVSRSAMANDAEGLRDLLQGGLRDEAMFIEDTGSGLKGSLSRVLPTTLAAIAYGAIEQDGQVVSIVDALWAGDSRAYILRPRQGLQVLTVDDTRETDALALIRNDQPMDNLVSADRPFVVHHAQVRLREPVVLVTATDGCFGYIRTPAHLEYIVLRNLLSASSAEEWSAGVLDALESFTADDASFAIVGLGYERFEDIQAAFADRYDDVARTHWEPFSQAENDPARIEQLREESWAAYADGYHELVIPSES